MITSGNDGKGGAAQQSLTCCTPAARVMLPPALVHWLDGSFEASATAVTNHLFALLDRSTALPTRAVIYYLLFMMTFQKSTHAFIYQTDSIQDWWGEGGNKCRRKQNG